MRSEFLQALSRFTDVAILSKKLQALDLSGLNETQYEAVKELIQALKEDHSEPEGTN